MWQVHIKAPFSDNSNKITLDRRTDIDRHRLVRKQMRREVSYRISIKENIRLIQTNFFSSFKDEVEID